MNRMMRLSALVADFHLNHDIVMHIIRGKRANEDRRPYSLIGDWLLCHWHAENIPSDTWVKL